MTRQEQTVPRDPDPSGTDPTSDTPRGHDDEQDSPAGGDAGGTGAAGEPSESHAGRVAVLAPFVAWMATQPIDEVTRRRHRQNVEAYLEWCRSDDGPTTGRRRRYENRLGLHHSRVERSHATAGLDQYARYRDLVARTLPIDR